VPNTYSWVVSQLECYPQHEGRTNVVFTIHWRRQATDGAHKADIYGSQNIHLDADAPFTPYAEITKAQVEGWLENALGAEKVVELDASLDKQIKDKKNPLVERPALPWA